MAAARLVFSLSLPSSTHGINRKFQPFLLTQTVAPSRVRALRCQANPESSEPQEKLVVDNGSTSETSPATKEASSGFPESPNRDVNRRVAVASVVAALALFLSTRLDFGISLKDLTASALPYEEALSNGKPTVVEFYADWCEVCRELAPDVYKIEQQYK
ncbi:hypothetical protein F2Q70_00033827 [Brassica cretica]|nr:hypothetical protein F2Q70_00033827 [Brassica cretica]